MVRAELLALAGLCLVACAPRGATQSRPTVARAGVVRAQTRSVANEARFPARGCTPSAPVVQGFAAQTAPLDALATAAELPEDEPVTAFEHGVLRAAWPSDWWPSRVDARDFSAYRLLTGDDDDVVSVYIGDRPSFRAPGGHEFRLVNGGTLIRGTLSRQDRRWRLEALALLPCASPRHAHVIAQSDDPRVIARVARALRALRVTRESAEVPQSVALDPASDRARLEALSQPSDAGVRAWLLAALATGQLRAKYPLTVAHARADQELSARVRSTVQGVSAELWLSLPVSGGRVQVTHVFNDASRMSSGDELSRTLAAAQCQAPSLTVAQDGVALRCQGESELRGAIDERDGEASLRQALARVLSVRSFVGRWRTQPSLAWGYPMELCDEPSASAASGAAANANANVSVVSSVASAMGVAMSARVGRCFLVMRGADVPRSALASLAIEGACAGVADAPWSQGLRGAGRFRELSGQQGQGECRYTAALRDGRGWVVSANDSESAMGPVGQGLTMGVDRAAIARAVGVMIELASMGMGRREEIPEGVAGPVLSALALDRPGTARARDVLRWWYALGGMDGALPVAVMEASSVVNDRNRVRVVFAAWTVEVTRAANGWTVTAIERTRW